MMVGISPVRSSPTIRRRSRNKYNQSLTATAAAGHQACFHRLLHRFGWVVGCVVLVLICFWQTTSTSRGNENDSTTIQTTTTTINHSAPQQFHYYEAYPQQGQYLRASSATTTTRRHQNNKHDYDVIVVGSGLAGLTTTLELLDRGGRVALVEKENTLGGNSLKASSGINACCTTTTKEEETEEDTLESFQLDTTKSAGTLARPALIEELVTSSASAVTWLQERVGVDLSQIAQLGGHSHPRTHRPAEGMVGAEIIVHLEQLIRTYQNINDDDEQEEEGHVTIYTNHPVIQLLKGDQQQQNRHQGQVTGVQIRNLKTNTTSILTAPQVVLATGGFAADRRSTSLLGRVRPDLVRFGTTGGSFSTGDGISLATSLGAQTTDLEQIQLHPTGFVDPKNPLDTTKVLAAELLRGVGGILLNPENGARFCNELGTRDYVTQQMLKSNVKDNAFTLLLTRQAAQQAQKHVDLYQRKGLLTKVQGVQALADWMKVPAYNLSETFLEYQTAMDKGVDQFGKAVFKGFPAAAGTATVEEQVFFVGTVTPVLHYCMGGLTIDVDGHVLDERDNAIRGLYAAGEVSGGVHGKNRLGGNSLLECTVYGRKIGQHLVLRHGHTTIDPIPERHQPIRAPPTISMTDTVVGLEELQKHNRKDDLWIALHGVVYNLTAFAGQHPGGAGIIETMAGEDATEAFATVHSKQLLQQFNFQPHVVMGKLEGGGSGPNNSAKTARTVTYSELKQHNTKEDCWVAFHGQVYDMTEFSKIHKGGSYLIQKYAGKDATSTYKAFHRKDKLGLVSKYLVGKLEDGGGTTA